MDQMTITQLGTIVGLVYTFWQFAKEKAVAHGEITELRTRVKQLEHAVQQQDKTLQRIERDVHKIMTAVARLEERIQAISENIIK